jgi:LacI family transcriptional regulator
MERLAGYGVRIPDDLAVISFNSTELSLRSHPPLTSVWQPLKEIGAAGVDLLVSLIKGRAEAERGHRFPVRLDVRESCGARARGLTLSPS